MKNTYKGDNTPKKIVRLDVWLRVLDDMGTFEKKNLLVLAGPEAGDVGVALGLGASPSNILAVDQDTDSITHAAWKYPDVPTYNGHVLGTVPERKFDFIFLDFCSAITESSLTIATTMAKYGLKKRTGYLAYTYLCGRESPKTAIHASVFKAQNGMTKDKKAFMSRAIVAHNELLTRLYRIGQVPVPLAYWFYLSKHGNGPNLPMATLLMRIDPAPKYSKTKAMDDLVKEKPEFIFVPDDNSALARKALMLDREGYDVPLLLNVSKGTLTAWKANASRGSY